MAKAKVELVGSLTHSHGARRFEKGKPQVLTNPSEIAYYRGQPGFSVTELDAPAPKPGKAAPAKPTKSKVPPPPADEDEAEDLDEDEDDEEEDEEEDDGPGDGQVETKSASKTYRKSDLEKLNKQKLFTLATVDFKLELDKAATKPQMIAAILKAQL